MALQQIAVIALIGAAAGMLSGMFGLGGAIVIIPALVLGMGYSQQMAQGTTLAMMVMPIGAMAAYQYYQNGFVDLKAALIMAAFFFAASYFGARLATQIPRDIMQKSFAVLLAAIAVKMWLQKQFSQCNKSSCAGKMACRTLHQQNNIENGNRKNNKGQAVRHNRCALAGRIYGWPCGRLYKHTATGNAQQGR